MNLIVGTTKKLNGTVIIPGSKSQTIRGLFVATLAKGTSVLANALMSEDIKSAILVCKNLDAKILFKNNQIIVSSNGLPLKICTRKINTGDSGITTRFVLPILGLTANPESKKILDCGLQMKNRPITSLLIALQKLGLSVKNLSKSNPWPIEASGNLIGGKAEVGGITSQYISALLLSLPLAKKTSVIRVKNLHERSYMEMTLAWLATQKIKYHHKIKKDKDIFTIFGNQKYLPFKKLIGGDFSSASYFLAAGVMLNGKIVIKGLDFTDSQGDQEFIEILKKMGAKISIKKNQIRVYGGRHLNGIKIDANNIPDLLPTLAVLGTYARGKTEIYNVAQARLKETDRINSMSLALRKMGAKIIEKKDGLIICQSTLNGAKVNGFYDHRTIMALSLAGMLATGKTIISTAEGINKTFPEFVRLMKSIGAKIKYQ